MKAFKETICEELARLRMESRARAVRRATQFVATNKVNDSVRARLTKTMGWPGAATIRFHRVGDLLDCARELFVGLQPITHF